MHKAKAMSGIFRERNLYKNYVYLLPDIFIAIGFCGYAFGLFTFAVLQ